MTDPAPGNPRWPETKEEIWAQGRADFRAHFPPTWTPNLGPKTDSKSFALWLGGWEEARWDYLMRQAAKDAELRKDVVEEVIDSLYHEWDPPRPSA